MKHCLALPKRLILMASLLLSSAALAEAPLFSADGYRLSHYRSPTPLSHDNARTLDTAALQQLLRERRYKAAYWGSVLWFIEAESLFAGEGTSWFSLIRQYQQQHRFRDQDLAAVIRSFDLLFSAAATQQPLSKVKNSAPAKAAQKLATSAPEALQQLWLRYQQQSASQILMQHPFSLIIEKSN